MSENPNDPRAAEAGAESDLQQGSTDPAKDDGDDALDAMPGGSTGDEVVQRQPATATNEEDQTED
jgi:hypothetical protein